MMQVSSAGDDVTLELLDHRHRNTLFALVERNRAYLRQWLPWLDLNTTPEDTGRFLQTAISQQAADEGPQYAVFHATVMCGVCGFHKFDNENKIGSIGYWLDEDHGGKGIMTRAVAELMRIGFDRYHLNKIEIRCAVDNLKSRAIPVRLGFQYDGILRQNEYLYGSYVDHAVYSMLISEYRR